MIKKIICIFLMSSSSLFAQFLADQKSAAVPEMHTWIDLYNGEETHFAGVMEDLAQSRVIYLGEVHTLKSHHRLHEEIISSLLSMKKKVILIMEQLETCDQHDLDRLNAGALDFTAFARKISWQKKWSNYSDYRSIMEAVVKGKGRIVAANAPDGLVKKIARGGLGSLSPEERKGLPAYSEPAPAEYVKLMSLVMGVHAFMKPEQSRSMVEAQSCRDGFMASAVVSAINREANSSDDTVFVVLAGAMHVKYGLGVPCRVRLAKGEIRDRIVLATSSGLKLSRAEKAMSRDISITHEDLRFIKRPVADYLYFIPQEKEPADEKDKDTMHPGPGN